MSRPSTWTPETATPCAICDKPLTRQQMNRRQKYCSSACSVTSQYRRIKRGNCKNCGKPLVKRQKLTCSQVCTGMLYAKVPHAKEPQFRELCAMEPPLSWNEISKRMGVGKNVIASLRRRLSIPNGPRLRRAYPTQANKRVPSLRSAAPERAALGWEPLKQTLPLFDFVPRRMARQEPEIRYSSYRSCQYPVTDERPHRFCGDPTRAGSPYCREHHALCYRPTPRMEARI